MKKLFSTLILGIFSLLIVLPLSLGVFLSHHHSSHHDSLCIEHCIESLGIKDEIGILQLSQEFLSKILSGIPIIFLFIAWIFRDLSILYLKNYSTKYQENFYLLLIGKVKSRT